MRIDIGSNILYESNFDDNTLPREDQNYESILSISGRGQFIEAAFRFDSEKISFRASLSEGVFIDIDVKELRDFSGSDEYAPAYNASILYDEKNKLLIIKFPMPIQYTEGIEFFAKTNDRNKTKKLKGYQVIVNREEA